MERLDRKTRKAERRRAQAGLFGLIDSYDTANIDLAIALMSGNRSLLDAAKRRYYPIMRMIDASLGGSWALLHEVRSHLGWYLEFFEFFYKHYVAENGLADVRDLLEGYLDEHFGYVWSAETWARMYEFPQLRLPRVREINIYELLGEDAQLDAGILEAVEDLSLSGETTLGRFLPYIAGMPSLKALNLSDMQLETLPLGVFNPRLESLRVRYCELKDIPKEIGELKRLKTLSLENNLIEYLPAEMAGLAELETLSLEYTRLKLLPDWLPSLVNLSNLQIGDSDVSCLPESVFGLPKLDVLGASRSRVREIRLVENATLRELFIDNTPLERVPDDMHLLLNLKTLSLSNTKLQKFPKGLLGCAELETLHLTGTRIMELPEAIVNLQKLLRLSIEGTRISKFPNYFSRLNLEEITLTRKQFNPNYKKEKLFLKALPKDCRVYDY